MNGIDIGILIIVLGSGVIGLVRGLTREFLGLIGWVGAALAAFFSLPFLREITRQHITNPTIADGVTILAVFIAFLVLFSLISHLLSGYIKESALGGIDRSLGLLYGLLRGFILVCLAEMVLSVFVPRPKHAEAIQSSHLAPTVYQGSDVIASMTPDNVKSFFQDFIDERNTKRTAEHAKNLKDRILNGELGQNFTSSAPHSSNSQGNDKPSDLEQEFLKRHSPQPSTESHETPSHTTHKYRVDDPDRTAHELARLKPRASADQQSDEGKGYNPKDRGEMERLLLMNEDRKRAQEQAEAPHGQAEAQPGQKSAPQHP